MSGRTRLVAAVLLALSACNTSDHVSSISRAVGFGGPADEKGWQPDSPGQSSQTSRSSSEIKPKRKAD